MSVPPKKQKLEEDTEWISSDSFPKVTQFETKKEILAVVSTALVRGLYTDFTIVAGEKGDDNAPKIPAHKFLLRAFSSVFDAMFESGMSEISENCVYIPDISYSVLRDMVDFVYTAEAPQFELHPIELLLAADRYEFKKLKVWCAGNIARNINLNNAVEVINTASSIKATSLYEKAKSFIMDSENKQKLNEMGSIYQLEFGVLADLFMCSPSPCRHSC